MGHFLLNYLDKERKEKGIFLGWISASEKGTINYVNNSLNFWSFFVMLFSVWLVTSPLPVLFFNWSQLRIILFVARTVLQFPKMMIEIMRFIQISPRNPRATFLCQMQFPVWLRGLPLHPPPLCSSPDGFPCALLFSKASVSFFLLILPKGNFPLDKFPVATLFCRNEVQLSV